MRIALNVPNTPDISTDRTSTSSASTESTSGASQVDKFSTDSVSLNSLSAQALQLPEVRHDKVDQVRQQIADGSYKVDAQKTAAAMLAA
jgi:negative regulator of flagellin synthesis FlgM